MVEFRMYEMHRFRIHWNMTSRFLDDDLHVVAFAAVQFAACDAADADTDLGRG